MLDETIYIFVLVCLLCCSAYFAACETAFTAYSKPKMFSIAKENKKAKIILELQKESELVIGTILTCSTILNTLIPVVSAEIYGNFFGKEFVIYFSFIIAILIILFAEVLPKMLTINSPENLLIPSAYFLKYAFIILKPVNNVIGYIAKKFIFLIKKGKNAQCQYVSSLEELKGVIDLHEGENKEDAKQEKEMLKSVLELGSVYVSQIMVHRKNVTMLCAEDDIKSLIDQVTNCHFTRIPIWIGNRDNIIGVLRVKSLLKAMKKCGNIEDIEIADITLTPWFIPENKGILQQLQDFKSKREHFAIVVDEYGSFTGIVTLEDIIEEIVGDISDERDSTALNSVKKQSDDSYIVDGSINIRDLNREINSDFKSDAFATVAGLVINSVGFIPDVGQIFSIDDYKFEILKKYRNQIIFVKLTKINKELDSID